MRRWRKVDAAATPENAARLQAGRQVNAVLGLVGAPIVLLGLVGLGVLLVAPLRQGPRLPRRPVDPDAGPAARPDRRLRRVRDGRRDVAPSADDRDARPRVARPDLVPRGQGHARAVATRSASTPHPTRGDDDRGGAAGPQRAPADRPGRGATRCASCAGWPSRRASSSPTSCPGSGRRSSDVRLEARGPRRQGRLDGREAEQGRRALGGQGHRGDRGRGRRASSSASTSRSRGWSSSAARPIVGGVVIMLFARSMPDGHDARGDDPGDARAPTGGRSRRRWSRHARCSRSSTRPGWPGSRRPDQAVVWGTALGLQGEIEDVLQRSLEDVREERRASRRRRTSRPGTRPRTGRRSRAAWPRAAAARSSRARRCPTSAA